MNPNVESVLKISRNKLFDFCKFHNIKLIKTNPQVDSYSLNYENKIRFYVEFDYNYSIKKYRFYLKITYLTKDHYSNSRSIDCPIYSNISTTLTEIEKYL
ncbi:hypothetical protein [Peptostreptococcus stomatis]|uniref:hypothetical protein n=1 Tax=Peptostreptococcus stomatis TaxID=341694 RepID=UPI000590B357|nr:hypothetical protein [Peptostreptococcus stomatis]